MKKIAEIIKSTRRVKKILQRDMALALNLSHRQYQRLEKSGNFSLAQLDIVCSELGLRVEVFKKRVFLKPEDRKRITQKFKDSLPEYKEE